MIIVLSVLWHIRVSMPFEFLGITNLPNQNLKKRLTLNFDAMVVNIRYKYYNTLYIINN
jgi:hypothetical protein